MHTLSEMRQCVQVLCYTCQCKDVIRLQLISADWLNTPNYICMHAMLEHIINLSRGVVLAGFGVRPIGQGAARAHPSDPTALPFACTRSISPMRYLRVQPVLYHLIDHSIACAWTSRRLLCAPCRNQSYLFATLGMRIAPLCQLLYRSYCIFGS